MIKLPSKKQIENARKKTSGDFGNKILYDLCEKHPFHQQIDIIIAKVWLIGRAYAAAVERGRNKEFKTAAEFYEKKVPSIFKKLDKYLNKLRSIDILDDDNLVRILKVHHMLIKLLEPISINGPKKGLHKRSFSSKYLHFHLPKLFFLYDSYSLRSLRNYVSRVPKEYNMILNEPDVDNEYAKFFIKCFVLKREINNIDNEDLDPRTIDKILYL
jgi:hypothetical protein